MATRATERANRAAANVERRVKIFSLKRRFFVETSERTANKVWEKIPGGHCPFSAAQSIHSRPVSRKLPETFGRLDFAPAQSGSPDSQCSLGERDERKMGALRRAPEWFESYPVVTKSRRAPSPRLALHPHPLSVVVHPVPRRRRVVMPVPSPRRPVGPRRTRGAGWRRGRPGGERLSELRAEALLVALV